MSFNPNQYIAKRALSTIMEDISEEAYCAGWVSGLEYYLWSVAQKGHGKVGRLEIKKNLATALKHLSFEADGWFIFSEKDDSCLEFINASEWLVFHNTSEYKNTEV